ncbi:hypothetical protein DL764_004214 [Monosporascus ibericus]|uniref:Uncharacterized protein n=1 Tax=Monosporascus ibericus TaxID=155417 RepID=A0A4Q4TE12_9PEZI|nr:hypothetical protein DL764_004214 [Monosporascus ibericus]
MRVSPSRKARVRPRITNFDKANAEDGFKGCEETQLEEFRRKAVRKSLAKEIEELGKAILSGEAAKKCLRMALNEKEEAEELREQAQDEADKKRDEFEALIALQKGLIYRIQDSMTALPRFY